MIDLMSPRPPKYIKIKLCSTLPHTSAYEIYECSLSTWKLYCRCLWNKEKQDKTVFTAPDCDNGIVYAVFEFPTLFRNYRRINSFAHLFSGYHCFFNFSAVKTFKNVCGYASLLPIWLWSCIEIVNLLFMTNEFLFDRTNTNRINKIYKLVLKSLKWWPKNWYDWRYVQKENFWWYV